MAIQACTTSKILILPEKRSTDSKICTLAHPRTSFPSRYLFDPEHGAYEFTRIAAPKTTCRSWLIGHSAQLSKPICSGKQTRSPSSRELSASPAESEATLNQKYQSQQRSSIANGYTIKNAELFIATPIDVLFILLPCLANASAGKTSQRVFLSLEDLLEELEEQSKHLGLMLDHPRFRSDTVGRMQLVCDFVEAGEEKMYRLNEDKLLQELVSKAEKMVEPGLPASMEDGVVSKALETPVMVMGQEETASLEENPLETDTRLSESTSQMSTGSQMSTATLQPASSAGSACTDTTIPDHVQSPFVAEDLYRLLRLRTALSYMMSTYIPPSLAASLMDLLKSDKSPIDFRPLDGRLAIIEKLRQEAMATMSFGDYCRKRSMYEGDEAVESKAEKKRKKEEDEKRKKAGESRGIRNLKKVDTKGMKKMSDFFGKTTLPRKK